ncbi:MAG TPA: peptide deformylase [Nevskiales bacterium]|nr:peptide deformylase [Nevskiales bacterium]
MAVLPILHHPDPRLRQRTPPVTDFGAELQRLVEDMFETMYAAPGVGLAANQVGVPLRLAVMDCSPDKAQPQPMVMANPVILHSAEPELMEEGCLSVPGAQEKVRRFRRLRVRAQDRHGQFYELEAEGLLAQCIQHELGHLDGQLYIDLLSELKRSRLLKKLQKADAREA